MASAGPNAPGTMADDSAVGTLTWTAPSSAKVSDNVYAQAGSPNNGTLYSHYLKATNFGFTIPDGSTIDGIAVAIERKAGANSASYYATDHVIKLVIGDTVSGDNKADTSTHWGTSDSAISYGGVSDKWGLTPSVDDINGSTFGVVLEGRQVKSGKVGSAVMYVDFISITVTYTEGGGGASAVPTIMNSYRQRRA